MSGGTPINQRSPLHSESAQSPLGILAALASPSPPIKSSRSSSFAANSESAALIVHKRESQHQDRDSGSRTPKISANTDSPQHSPSAQAARRLDRRISRAKNNTENNDIGDNFNDAENLPNKLSVTSSSRNIRIIDRPDPMITMSDRSPKRPHAIPATQLDVLALVTATSPPMPSRRRWAAQSTTKPAFSRDILPNATHVACNNHNPHTPNQHQTYYRSVAGDSGSDTVSEDEQTLRTYSAQIRARHHHVDMRSLPDSPATMMTESMQREISHHNAQYLENMRPAIPSTENVIHKRPALYPNKESVHPESVRDSQIRKQRCADNKTRNTQRNNEEDGGSGGDTTETDEEMRSCVHTPISRRNITPSRPLHFQTECIDSKVDRSDAYASKTPRSGPQTLPHVNQPTPLTLIGCPCQAKHRISPASGIFPPPPPQPHSSSISSSQLKPVLIGNRQEGYQLPPATEPVLRRRNRHRYIDIDNNTASDSSLSLSPSPSSSRRRQIYTRRQAQDKQKASTNGSETETDTEIPRRVQQKSDTETETETERYNSVNDGSVDPDATESEDELNSTRRSQKDKTTSNRTTLIQSQTRKRQNTIQSNASNDTVDSTDFMLLSGRKYTTIRDRQYPSKHVSTSKDQYQNDIYPFDKMPTKSQKSNKVGTSTNGKQRYEYAIPMYNEEEDDGDTTETDDEFFDSRSIHYSIKPPRRVVRHLASLHARDTQPTILMMGQHTHSPQPSSPPRLHESNMHDHKSARLSFPPQNVYSPHSHNHPHQQRITSSNNRILNYNQNRPVQIGIKSSRAEYQDDNESQIAPPTSGAMSNFGLGINASDDRSSSTQVLSNPSTSDANKLETQYCTQRFYSPRLQSQNDFDRYSNEYSPPYNQFPSSSYAMDSAGSVSPKLGQCAKSPLLARTVEASVSSSRKRALTAPSLLESPIDTEKARISSGRNTIEDRIQILGEESIKANNSTPRREIHQMQQTATSQVNLPGVSPISSLRSSLSCQHSPGYATSSVRQTASTTTPIRDKAKANTSASLHAAVQLASISEVGLSMCTDTEDSLHGDYKLTDTDDIGSPSLDAASRRERRNNKKRGLSGSIRIREEMNTNSSRRRLNVKPREMGLRLQEFEDEKRQSSEGTSLRVYMPMEGCLAKEDEFGSPACDELRSASDSPQSLFPPIDP